MKAIKANYPLFYKGDFQRDQKMANNGESNPFTAFLSENGVEKSLVGEVFMLTLKKSSTPAERRDLALLCLADIIVDDKTDNPNIGNDLLGHMIFERLMLSNPRDYLLPGNNEEQALTTDGLLYLHRAYIDNLQIQTEKRYKESSHDIVQNIIILNTTTLMRQPAIFPGRSLDKQWMNLFGKAEETFKLNETMDFLCHIIKKIYEEDETIEAEGVLKANFYPLLNRLQQKLSTANLVTIDKKIFSILNFFVSDKRIPQMGKILIDHSTPNPNSGGNYYIIDF